MWIIQRGNEWRKFVKYLQAGKKMSRLNSCVLHEFQRSEKNIPTYIQGIEGAYRLKCQSVELRNENSLVLKISCYAICRLTSSIRLPFPKLRMYFYRNGKFYCFTDSRAVTGHRARLQNHVFVPVVIIISWNINAALREWRWIVRRSVWRWRICSKPYVCVSASIRDFHRFSNKPSHSRRSLFINQILKIEMKPWLNLVSSAEIFFEECDFVPFVFLSRPTHLNVLKRDSLRIRRTHKRMKFMFWFWFNEFYFSTRSSNYVFPIFSICREGNWANF